MLKQSITKHIGKKQIKTARQNKTKLNIVITGGTRGFGKAMVEEFVKYGDNVYAISRNPEHLESLMKTYPNVIGKAIDIGDTSSIDLMMKDIEASIGHVDIFINNAGCSGGFREFETLNTSEIENIVRTNLIGMMLCCQAMFYHMNKLETGGAIFNTTGAGSDGNMTPKFSVYGATKAGVLQFTKTLQNEWKDEKVDVHIVSPGMMLTPLLLDNLDEETFTKISKFCSDPYIVAHHLVPRMRRAYFNAHDDVYIEFLTFFKVIVKVLFNI